jgi:ABC-type transport system involved in multi-copper enzyme maturation permease subunit
VSHTFVLALNTFREAVRDRVLTAVLVFGGVFVVGAVVAAPLALGEHERVIRDLGLAAISFFTVLMIVLLGTGMVYREIEQRTIHTILTHPVARPAFILGKFLGLYATVLLSILILSVVYLGVVAAFAGGVQPDLLVTLGLAAAEALVVTSVAILFSTVASPMLSAVFTFCVYVAGHLAYDILELVRVAENRVLEPVAKLCYLILPSLHYFDTRNSILSGVPVPAGQLVWCAEYAVLYSAAVLIVTMVAFSRRDFE